jgi:cardiolipin synthase A/B
MDSTAYLVISLIGTVTLAFMLFMALFEPGLPYRVQPWVGRPRSHEEFVRVLEAVTDTPVHRRTQVEVLTNGEVFYEPELQAIRGAQHSVNLEAYIFAPGEVARRFVEALTERARAGVQVRMVMDAIGSFAAPDSLFRELRQAGGQVAWYHPLRWHTLARLNYRTHRNLLIVDGRIGFLGGAGWADHWLLKDGKNPRWRDTMFRVHGEAVTSLQAAFLENWLEASGEILADPAFYPRLASEHETLALVVGSSPSTGRSTRARILYQTLLSAAERTIDLTTPYFVPDRSARQELIRAMQERGVRLRVLVPGRKADVPLTRRSARRIYGELLQAGAEIYEYEPAMMHAKAMVIDDLWTIVGSTNFSNRSFGINDEVNLAACDRELALRLKQDFSRDLEHSHRISYEEWRRRPLLERVTESFGWLLERQQ